MAATRKFKLLCLENPLLGKAQLSTLALQSDTDIAAQISKAKGKSNWPTQRRLRSTTNALYLRDAAMLEKYGLKANDAILADESKHMDLYEDLIQNHDAKLIAGGSAQNIARGAAVCHTSHPLPPLAVFPRWRQSLHLLVSYRPNSSVVPANSTLCPSLPWSI